MTGQDAEIRATGKHVLMLTGAVIETPVKCEYTLNRWHEEAPSNSPC